MREQEVFNMVVQREESPPPRIPEFFAGRAVFITGATGFMGQVLVERLLATCPDVGHLFLLLRDKAGVRPSERLMALKRSQVFDVLRESDPAQLDKLRVVSGDITRPGLGISPDSMRDLEEVSVVFNCAATVRFDEPLRAAAEQNVLSVYHLMDVCDRLPHIKSFVHVSTGYSNAELSSVEERVYPLPSALPSMLASALALPNDTPGEEVKRLISPKPNTYTYTKALGEAALAQRSCAYARALLRPTIVTGALRSPRPGWMAGYNGPAGVIVAIGSGLLHVFRCDGSRRADLLPVDVAIDTLIAVAWETAVDNPPTVRVYNCSTSENPTTWEAMRAAVVRGSRREPQADVAWYPSCLFTSNRFVYQTMKFLVQTAPFHIIEYSMRIFSHQKTRMNLIKVHGRLSSMNDVLEYFATREWAFSCARVRRLRARLAPADNEIFNLDPNTIDWKQYYKDFVRGCRVYLSKDKEENLPESRKRLQRIYLIHRTITILVPILLLYQLLNPRLLYNAAQHSIHFAALMLASVGKAFGTLTQFCGTICTWFGINEVIPFRIVQL